VKKITSSNLRCLAGEIAFISIKIDTEMWNVTFREYNNNYQIEKKIKEIFDRGLFFVAIDKEVDKSSSGSRLIVEHEALEWFVAWITRKCDEDNFNSDYPVAMGVAMILEDFNNYPLGSISSTCLDFAYPHMRFLISAINDAALWLFENENKSEEVAHE